SPRTRSRAPSAGRPPRAPTRAASSSASCSRCATDAVASRARAASSASCPDRPTAQVANLTGGRRPTEHARMARFGSLILALCISTSTACGDDPYRGGPCSDFTPFETALVPVSAVSRVIPLGELDPPEDVVPSVGGGFGFNQATA